MGVRSSRCWATTRCRKPGEFNVLWFQASGPSSIPSERRSISLFPSLERFWLFAEGGGELFYLLQGFSCVGAKRVPEMLQFGAGCPWGQQCMAWIWKGLPEEWWRDPDVSSLIPTHVGWVTALARGRRFSGDIGVVWATVWEFSCAACSRWPCFSRRLD